MATRQLYQLRDRKANDTVGPVVPHKNMQPAVRMFYDVLANKDTGPGAHPADYELLYVGTQNDETGEITGGQPQLVATGEDWLRQNGERLEAAPQVMNNVPVPYGPGASGSQQAAPLAPVHVDMTQGATVESWTRRGPHQ